MDTPPEVKIVIPTIAITIVYAFLATSLIRSWGPMSPDAARIVVGVLLVSTFVVSLGAIKVIGDLI